MHPEEDRGAAREMVPAGLREVAPAGNPEARRQRLQQNRHQVRQQDDAEKRVPVARPAFEVRRPVARIHVADGDQVAGPGKREQLAQKPPVAGTGIEPWTSGRLTLGRGPAASRRRDSRRGRPWSTTLRQSQL